MTSAAILTKPVYYYGTTPIALIATCRYSYSEPEMIGLRPQDIDLTQDQLIELGRIWYRMYREEQDMDAEEQVDCSYIAWLSHFAPWRREVIREALGLTIDDWLQILQPGVADGDVGDWKREGF